MDNELTTLDPQKIKKYKDYVKIVLKKESNSIDFDKITEDSDFLCTGTEYFDFNIDDLCIEMINNLFNSIQCHDVHMVILVELVSTQIRQTENLELMNQYYHKKIHSIVFEEFIQIFFTNKPLQMRKETIIKNSYNKFYENNNFNLVRD